MTPNEQEQNMAYTRMENGTTVMTAKINEADTIAICKCGGEIVAIEANEDGDWVAYCTGCGESSCWMQGDFEVVEYAPPVMEAEIISLEDRRLACRQ